uniref:Ig-like domain-containing protein n=1 Tax=Trichobilharzia regenti TaxID=157069 RepID=A0AA85IZH9_TRIRE|nr:unnamed protein product [Trichobilharzia regenti]
MIFYPLLWYLLILSVNSDEDEIQGTLNGFDSEDIEIKIGDRAVFKCGVLSNKIPLERQGYWEGRIIRGRHSIIDMEKRNNQIFIKPSNNYTIYLKSGIVEIECTLINSETRDIILQFTKMITITGCDKVYGTINLIDASDIVIPIGSKDQFQCGLLPKGIESQLSGYWSGQFTQGKNHYLVSMIHNNGKVYIKKPSNADIYDMSGIVKLKCTFKRQGDNVKLYEFERSIKITHCMLQTRLVGSVERQILKRYCELNPRQSGLNARTWIRNYAENPVFWWRGYFFDISRLSNGTAVVWCTITNWRLGKDITTHTRFIHLFFPQFLQTPETYGSFVSLPVGSNAKIYVYETWWDVNSINSKFLDNDLFSLNVKSNGFYVQPPKNYEVYPKAGRKHIPIDRYGRYFIKIYIEEIYTGTLNNIDSSDVWTKIGSKDTFKCGLLSHRYYNPLTYWASKQISGPKDVIHIDHVPTGNIIEPSICHLMYKVPAKIRIQCSLMASYRNILHRFEKTLTVIGDEICAAYKASGLNHILLKVGSNDTFDCDMKPDVYKYNEYGYWYADYADTESITSNIVSIKNCYHKAIIGPPLDSDVYIRSGQVDIYCYLIPFKNHQPDFALHKRITILDILMYPENLTFYVGDDIEPICTVTGISINNLHSIGYLQIVPLKPIDDILSVIHAIETPFIRPPRGYRTYPKPSHIPIECIFTSHDGKTIKSQFEIHILNKSMRKVSKKQKRQSFSTEPLITPLPNQPISTLSCLLIAIIWFLLLIFASLTMYKCITLNDEMNIDEMKLQSELTSEYESTTNEDYQITPAMIMNIDKEQDLEGLVQSSELFLKFVEKMIRSNQKEPIKFNELLEIIRNCERRIVD